MTAVPLGSQIKLDLKESFQNEVDCDDKMILWVGVLMISQGFPCGSAGEESTCNVGDLGLIHGLGRSPGEGKGYPLQYSGLENSIDCTVCGATESDTTEQRLLSATINL